MRVELRDELGERGQRIRRRRMPNWPDGGIADDRVIVPVPVADVEAEQAFRQVTLRTQLNQLVVTGRLESGFDRAAAPGLEGMCVPQRPDRGG